MWSAEEGRGGGVVQERGGVRYKGEREGGEKGRD